MPNIGFTELLVVVGIAVVVFGSKRIPEAARGLGRSFSAFKEGLRSVTDEK